MNDDPAEAYQQFRANYEEQGNGSMVPWGLMSEGERLSWINSHQVYVNDTRNSAGDPAIAQRMKPIS